MIIDEALRKLLRDLLGSDRVYSHRAPQSLPSPADAPYIVLYRVSPAPAHAHTGPNPTIEQRYQVSAYGKSQTATATFADDARRLINGWSGHVSDGLSPESTMYLSSILWQSGTYGYNDDTERHHFSNDFAVRYRED